MFVTKLSVALALFPGKQRPAWQQSRLVMLTDVLEMVLQSVKPDAPVPTSVLAGAFGGYFQAARAAIIELASADLALRFRD